MTSLLFPGGSTTGGSTSGSGGIRFSPDLSDGEKKAIENRKAKVSSCLKNLGIKVDPNNVPQIAVVVSGGSLTATIACLGSLLELKNQNLLDAVTYIAGCSGSTWCMAPLYEKGNWTQNLDSIATEMCDKLASLSFDAKKGLDKLLAAAEQDNYSLTHFWAYGIVNYTVKGIIENGISSHRAPCESGSVPYPFYSAADKLRLDTKGRNDAGAWFEFTPNETGYPLLGAFVSSELFDCKFSNGKLVKKEPEHDLCYLEAICSTALADLEATTKLIIEKMFELLVDPYAPSTNPAPINLLSGVPVIGKYAEFLSSTLKLEDAINGPVNVSKAVLENLITSLNVVHDTASAQLVKLMNDRWDTNDGVEKAHLAATLKLLLALEFGGLVIPIAKLLIKTVLCLCGWIWGTTDNFLYKSSGSMPSDITDKELRYFIDGGLAINSPYPCILRKVQNVQAIISFEFFPALDPHLGIKQTVDYCKANNIPFPKVEIDTADRFNPKDCYIFEGEDAPTVIHIPLFNNVTSKGMVQERTAQYSIVRLQYTKTEINDLMEVSTKNNAGKIKEAILRKCSI
ncbi:cytosolic phospholipase A2 gamma-like [Rhinatrema bivittatum]|uniref:cytosolic phospholipase A2 gamma-like n=1 Tax=Rhinatrema bivittatum TaxID=194408 RepID=UPI00112908E5|nr:cytosolic phospholipase A2 gamma-like [Rhinatrema bivittatum]XP_029436553.1 cytosolic phospholipase A2 gamma-like [Rhinatrema bivittatum]